MDSSPERTFKSPRPLTPRYQVSPGTVHFLEERYHQVNNTPPPSTSAPGYIPPLTSPGSPDVSLYSPETQMYIYGKYIDLFGFTPTKDAISPLPPTPPAALSSADVPAKLDVPSSRTADYVIPLREGYRLPVMTPHYVEPPTVSAIPASDPHGNRRRHRHLPAWLRKKNRIIKSLNMTVREALEKGLVEV